MRLPFLRFCPLRNGECVALLQRAHDESFSHSLMFKKDSFFLHKQQLCKNLTRPFACHFTCHPSLEAFTHPSKKIPKSPIHGSGPSNSSHDKQHETSISHPFATPLFHPSPNLNPNKCEWTDLLGIMPNKLSKNSI